MEENNLIQERLERISPYLRGITYDQTQDMYLRIHIMIPKIWNYKSLIAQNLVLTADHNEVSWMIVIGLDPKKSKDIAVDHLLNFVEEVVEFNKKEAKKQKILQQKIRQLQQMSLEDIESLEIPVELNDDISESDFETSFYGGNFSDPMLQQLRREMPVQQQVQNHQEFTPLYQNTTNNPALQGNVPPRMASILDDGIQVNVRDIDEINLYDGLEIIPDDPEEQRQYYLNQQLELQRQAKLMQQQQMRQDNGGNINYNQFERDRE